jgi:phospholipid N-methyltransferase
MGLLPTLQVSTTLSRIYNNKQYKNMKKENRRLIAFLYEEFKKVSLAPEEYIGTEFEWWFKSLKKEEIQVFAEMAIQHYVNKATEGLYENN